MDKIVLLVTAIDGAQNLASAVSREADCIVEVAHSRRAGLARLRRGPVTTLLVDSTLPATETTSSDMLWQNAGGAIPLELDVPQLGFPGVICLLRRVLEGREQAEEAARREAASAVAEELRSTVTSLLLESDIMLREQGIPPAVMDRMHHLRSLANTLRTRLRPVN